MVGGLEEDVLEVIDVKVDGAAEGGGAVPEAAVEDGGGVEDDVAGFGVDGDGVGGVFGFALGVGVDEGGVAVVAGEVRAGDDPEAAVVGVGFVEVDVDVEDGEAEDFDGVLVPGDGVAAVGDFENDGVDRGGEVVAFDGLVDGVEEVGEGQEVLEGFVFIFGEEAVYAEEAGAVGIGGVAAVAVGGVGRVAVEAEVDEGFGVFWTWVSSCGGMRLGMWRKPSRLKESSWDWVSGPGVVGILGSFWRRRMWGVYERRGRSQIWKFETRNSKFELNSNDRISNSGAVGEVFFYHRGTEPQRLHRVERGLIAKTRRCHEVTTKGGEGRGLNYIWMIELTNECSGGVGFSLSVGWLGRGFCSDAGEGCWGVLGGWIGGGGRG